MDGRIFSSCGIIEPNSKANKLTSGKWTQVSQALVVQKRIIRFHLNFKTIRLVLPLFLMVLDLTTREFDADTSKSQISFMSEIRFQSKP